MSKARTLANLISDNAELADGQISVAEVVGAAPLASPTFTGTVTTDAVTMNGNTTIGNSSTDTLTVRATTTFTNIGTGAAAGPYVNLLRDSSSPADDDFIGILSWQGKNDADQTVTYGQIAGRIADASDGSEDARIDLQGIVAGTTRSIMQYESGLTQFNAAGQDIDFKVHSTGKTHALFVDAGNDSVHIGGSGSNYVANIHSSTVNSPEGALFVNAAMNNSGKGVFIDGNTRSINENTERLLQVRDRSAYNAFIVQVDGRSVFNDDGSSWQDFRVESDTNTHALFVDAGNGTTAFGTTTDNYNHASNEGIYLSPGSSSSFTANGPPIRVNRNGTGGNDRSNVEFYNNGAIRGWIGSLGAEDGIFLYANGSRGMHLYSDEMVVNQDSHDYDFRVESNNASHMFYVDSTNGRIGINTNTPAHMLNLAGTGDVGIHIQGDTDNYVENDNPYLSMSQDGSSAQQLKIGMVGDAGQEFNNSVANAAFIHANNASDQPFQIAHFGDAVVDFYKSSVVFNQAGRDQNFRIESDANAHAFFVDAQSSEVFVGLSGQADVAARVHVSVANNIGIEVSDPDTSGFYGLWFARAGVQKGYTQTTGSGTTYNTGSDARLKENVSTITDGIDVLNQMRAVEFDWIGEDDEPRTRGFIAQEMVGVAPECVSGDPEGEIMMGMDYGRITPVIVAALQEAITKIETLEARITALENA